MNRTPRRPIRDLSALRFASTGLSFLLFGLIGTLLGLAAVPFLMAIPGSALERRRRVRRMIRLAFRAFVGFMNQTGGLSYSFAGIERLGRAGQLIIANHPSLIDVVLLIAFIPDAGCVVKRAAWRNPSMMIAVSAAGYVPNVPTERMVARAAAALENGECLIMFPEGTRTRPGAAPRFHRGAASVAVRAARIVTPVFIRVEPAHLSKGAPWYRIPATRPHYSLCVGPDIEMAPFRLRPRPLASRELNRRFEITYAREGGAP